MALGCRNMLEFVFYIYICDITKYIFFTKYIDCRKVLGKINITFEQVMCVCSNVFSYCDRHCWKGLVMINTSTLWAVIYSACSRTVHRPSGPHIVLLSTSLDAESCPLASATISTLTGLGQCIHCLVFPILNNTFRLLLFVFDWFVVFFSLF